VRGGGLVGVLALGGRLAVTVAAGEEADLAAGRRVYEQHCAVCHGAAGDGRGEAAGRLQTAPRDFTGGRYKFRSTGSGQLPTDADLVRSIAQGMPGTAMVPQDHLSPAEIQAVALFLKTLSPRFAGRPAPRPLAITAPPPLTPEALVRGRAAYVKGECAECHGREARGDGPSAKDLKIKPTDLSQRPLKSGPAARDILRTVLTGLDGTPMPSYHQVLEDDELWDLAYYVEALGGPDRMTDDERIGWEVERRQPPRRP
jgi:cytochrome c oxidase cbb3-type subunit 2